MCAVVRSSCIHEDVMWIFRYVMWLKCWMVHDVLTVSAVSLVSLNTFTLNCGSWFCLVLCVLCKRRQLELSTYLLKPFYRLLMLDGTVMNNVMLCLVRKIVLVSLFVRILVSGIIWFCVIGWLVPHSLKACCAFIISGNTDPQHRLEDLNPCILLFYSRFFELHVW